MPYWCPNCEEEIDHLQYNASVNEWGSYNLRTSDQDCHDSEINDTEYECPHCNNNLDPDDVLQDNPRGDNEEATLPTVRATRESTLVNEPNQRIVASTRQYHNSIQDKTEFVECSKCKRQLSVTEEDKNLEEIECNCKNIIKIK